MSRYICLTFLYFPELNFIFTSSRDTFVNEMRNKKSRKYYDKYALMLTIHVDNHFTDKFVPPCHVGYFISGDR